MLYKCYWCEKTSFPEEWDQATDIRFRGDKMIVSVTENDEFAFHTCPKCKEDNAREDIEEV